MLRLPRYLTIDNIDRFLVELDTAIKVPSEGAFKIDFANITRVDPAGIVTLANACDFLRRKNLIPVAHEPLPTNAAIRYLKDARFFQLLADPAGTELVPGHDTAFPLTRVRHAQTYDLLTNKFLPWLGGRLNISDASLEQLRMSLGELFNNISDHADVPTGFFFAQHFPDDRRVGIGLADFGVGIPARVRSKFPELPDGAAILKAFEEGFTTQTTPRNRGAGLDWLKRYVVDSNGGTVDVYSHFGRLVASPGTDFRDHQGEGHFPGVLYYIVLRTDTIEPVEETREALEW